MLKFLLIVSIIFQVSLSYANDLKIICSTDNPSGSLHVVILEKFKELVEKYSSNKIKVEVHYRGNSVHPEIRGEESNVNMLQYGSDKLHVSVMAVGNLSAMVPVLEFLTYPYLFENQAQVRKLLSSQFMSQEINDYMIKNANIYALGWAVGGARHISNAVREIKNLSDIQGLKIRTPNNFLMRDTYQSFGATVETINWAKTKVSLKDKSVSGQENPLSVFVDSKFWEVGQKFITRNGPFQWIGPLLINYQFLSKQSQNNQEIIKRAGKEAVEFQWSWFDKKEDEFEKIIKSHGVKISDLNDKREWIKKSRPLWELYYRRIGNGDTKLGMSIVDKALKILK